ncbi:hypothetical protein QTP86_026380, partial [Hemibagrus guttatus]
LAKRNTFMEIEFQKYTLIRREVRNTDDLLIMAPVSGMKCGIC